MFPFSSNEGIYRADFTFCVQIVLRRKVKQRLATAVTFKGVTEEQNVSREGAGETEEHNQFHNLVSLCM